MRVKIDGQRSAFNISEQDGCIGCRRSIQVEELNLTEELTQTITELCEVKFLGQRDGGFTRGLISSKLNDFGRRRPG